jgi:predicted ATPase
MQGKRLIEKIRLRNILSFGDKGEEITLEPLNIIIGQNASGKSNLVDVIKLLRSLPQDNGLVNFISRNGGISEWIWKGKIFDEFDAAEIEFVSNHFEEQIGYGLFLFAKSSSVGIIDEIIENKKTGDVIRRDDEQFRDRSTKIPSLKLGFGESILSLTVSVTGDKTGSRSFLQYILTKILVFSDLQTNRKSEIRHPQDLSANDSFLEEDGSNLGLVLNDLEIRGDTREKIIENLKKFNPRIKAYATKIIDVVLQLYIREEGLDKPISAKRLSDGTLHYLCLLAILCHPEPPPLICIEEPETGLHPDILPTIAELMKEAAQRTQLIVTTHSDILVSAFSDMPEAVLVCEKDEDGTHFKRLEAEKLKEWLDEYTLGEVWLRGGIGGTRW